MLFQTTIVAAVASLAGLAQAKGDYMIDPESVPESTREHWCVSARESCPFLCEDQEGVDASVNDCDPETLQYGCLCENNKQPNMSEYSMTIPYFTCMEWGNQCVEDCGGDSGCATSCREDNPCGAQNPTRINATESSAAAPSATGDEEDEDEIFGSPGDDESSDDNDNGNGSGAVSALALGRQYGLGVVLGSMFLGFALL